MYKKIQKFWTSLNRPVIVNKRELFLGVTACTLTGILIGILVSPKKALTIGSYNGNNHIPENQTVFPEADLGTPTSDVEGA